MRTIAVVTVGRSDYGIYRPVLARLRGRSDVKLHLIVAGMHLVPKFGDTIREIDSDGIPVGDRVGMLLAADAPESVAVSMGLGTIGFAQAYARTRPDLLVVLGDRSEMHAAAIAAVPFAIPIAHIHGGELTEGAIDDALRHSLTKLSHLHFVSTEAYARRVRQMGEEAWRVTVSGAPGLDNLHEVTLLEPRDVAARLGLPADQPPLLVSFHPATLEPGQAGHQVVELLAALQSFDIPAVFTMPNADAGGQEIAARIEAYVKQTPAARLVPSFGTAGYFSLMAWAAVMVGNSSSGIIEAQSFQLPVVNIGTRQRGRVRAANVIDVGAANEDIRRGIARAIEPAFRHGLAGVRNPYGDGRASQIIADRLATEPLGSELLTKRFADAVGGQG